MKQLFFAIIAILCFSGCGKHMYSTMSSGKENQSFVIVLRQEQNYPSGVTVVVDDKEHFTVEKVFKMKFQRKARPVVITPGKHSIQVLFEGKELYRDEIFIGLQETKKVILP